MKVEGAARWGRKIKGPRVAEALLSATTATRLRARHRPPTDESVEDVIVGAKRKAGHAQIIGKVRWKVKHDLRQAVLFLVSAAWMAEVALSGSSTSTISFL